VESLGREVQWTAAVADPGGSNSHREVENRSPSEGARVPRNASSAGVSPVLRQTLTRICPKGKTPVTEFRYREVHAATQALDLTLPDRLSETVVSSNH